MSNLRLYILIHEDVPDTFAPVSAAHASLAAWLKWGDDPLMREWEKTSFRKVVCRVTDRAFQRAKRHPDHLVMQENSLMGNPEVSLVFKVREDWPQSFRFYDLWSPKVRQV